MEEFEKIENEFYCALGYHMAPTSWLFSVRNVEKLKTMWQNICQNTSLLNWAITPCKDKFGKKDLFNGLAICEQILRRPNEVDNQIYQALVEKIFSSKDLARLVLDGYSNGGYSFLPLAVSNKNFKLTSEQKAFAVDEAMNLFGTVRQNQIEEEYKKHLDEQNVSDDKTVLANFGRGVVTPVGQRTMSEYLFSTFQLLDDKQAHGVAPFDLRYYILQNSNWTDEEKQTLVFDFWESNKEFCETIKDWITEIIDDNANFDGGRFLSPLDETYLFDYKKQDLAKLYSNPADLERIWSEIEFCKKIDSMGPSNIWDYIDDEEFCEEF